MSGFKAPEHTQVPNSFFDMMADMSEVELRVTLCAIRKTFGWHKRQDAISLTQFQDMTGLSRQGVLNGIEESEKRGTIRKAGKGKRNTTIFELCVIEEQPEPKPDNVVSLDQSTQLTSSSQHSRPEVVNTVDTQKKENKPKESTPLPPSQDVEEKVTPMPVGAVDEDFKQVVNQYMKSFPLRCKDKDEHGNKTDTFEQDAPKLQGLLNVHGLKSLLSAIEKSTGKADKNPVSYISTICSNPDHKLEVQQQGQLLAPYHKRIETVDEPRMTDEEAQAFAKEARAKIDAIKARKEPIAS